MLRQKLLIKLKIIIVLKFYVPIAKPCKVTYQRITLILLSQKLRCNDFRHFVEHYLRVRPGYIYIQE